MQLFPNGVKLIEVIELKQCNFKNLYIGSNLGIIGTVIYQQDGQTFYDHKLLGKKLNDKIVLRDENGASVNDVFIIILRTYNKVTATTTNTRLLQASERGLQADSQYGTLYISDDPVSESGETVPFNWLMYIVVPVCSLVVVILVVVFIMCCCCKKSSSESIPAPKKKEPQSQAKNAKPMESQRTVHDESTRDVVQPIYMPSDRSLGGKPIPLDSRKDIPKTQENSFISSNSNIEQPKSTENHYGITPDRTPGMTPDRTPDMTPDRTPDMTPERRSLDGRSQENEKRTPSKSPRRRVARRRRAR